MIDVEAGQFDEAIKLYQQIADAKPLEAGPYISMAEIRQEQRNLEDARRLIDKAKEIDKFSPEVRRADALLLAEEGKFPEAIAAIKGLLDHDSVNPTTIANQAEPRVPASITA